MPIQVSCPSCAARYTLSDAQAGKRLKCRTCNGPIDVPAATLTAAVSPVASPAASGVIATAQATRPQASARPTAAVPEASAAPAAPTVAAAGRCPACGGNLNDDGSACYTCGWINPTKRKSGGNSPLLVGFLIGGAIILVLTIVIVWGVVMLFSSGGSSGSSGTGASGKPKPVASNNPPAPAKTDDFDPEQMQPFNEMPPLGSPVAQNPIGNPPAPNNPVRAPFVPPNPPMDPWTPKPPSMWRLAADPAPKAAPLGAITPYSITIKNLRLVAHSQRLAVLAAGSGDTAAYRLLDLTTGKAAPKLGDVNLSGAAISPDGKTIAGFEGKSCVVRSLADASQVASPRVTMSGSTDTAMVLGFVGEDRIVVCRGNDNHGSLGVYMLNGGITGPMGRTRTYLSMGTVQGLKTLHAGSPSGRYWVTRGFGNELRFHDAAATTTTTGAASTAYLPDHPENSPDRFIQYTGGESLAFSPDGREFVVMLTTPGQFRLTVFDMASGMAKADKLLTDPGLSKDYRAIAWLPDGSGFVLGGQAVVDRKTLAITTRLGNPKGKILFAHMLDEKTLCVAAQEDEGIHFEAKTIK